MSDNFEKKARPASLQSMKETEEVRAALEKFSMDFKARNGALTAHFDRRLKDIATVNASDKEIDDYFAQEDKEYRARMGIKDDVDIIGTSGEDLNAPPGTASEEFDRLWAVMFLRWDEMVSILQVAAQVGAAAAEKVLLKDLKAATAALITKRDEEIAKFKATRDEEMGDLEKKHKKEHDALITQFEEKLSAVDVEGEIPALTEKSVQESAGLDAKIEQEMTDFFSKQGDAMKRIATRWVEAVPLKSGEKVVLREEVARQIKVLAEQAGFTVTEGEQEGKSIESPVAVDKGHPPAVNNSDDSAYHEGEPPRKKTRVDDESH